MKRHFVKDLATVVTLGTIVMLGACKKKVASAPPPPPPPPTAPTASISVDPNSIQAGGSASLIWQTTNATDVSIAGIGAVQANGSQTVSPNESTTYRLTAKGPGGTQEASTRLTVTQPPPPLPSAPSISDEDLFNQNIKDIYFDFDKSDVRTDQEGSMQTDVAFLTQHSAFNLTIEGHCDERGSIEYNIALGDKRANTVKNALIGGGVTADRINTISYGKEKPFCTEHDEACWQQNRRGHFVYRR
jgi:peptidoglycan-associated lipoprotein